MHTLLSIAAAILLLSLSASAQERSTTDVTLSYSYLRANPASSAARNFNINGGAATLTFNPLFARGWLGLAGDFGGYNVGKVGNVNIGSNLFTYMGGPQLNLPRFHRVSPFARVLFGGAHSTGNALGISGSRNSFAMAPGAGLDFRISRHMSLRAGPVEYLLTDFKESTTGGRQVQNNLRVSTGVRWRF